MQKLYGPLLGLILLAACSQQPDDLNLKVTAVDDRLTVSFSSDSVEQVRYFVDGTYKHKESRDPYDFTLNKSDYSAGDHVLRLDIYARFLSEVTKV